MIQGINQSPKIDSLNIKGQQDKYQEALKVLSSAINIENGIGKSSNLTFTERSQILSDDIHLANSLEGYKELKAYVQEKLTRLKTLGPMGTSMMTHMLTEDKKGIMLKDQIGLGFSDVVYFVKLEEKESLFEMFSTSGNPLFIMTPIDSPFIKEGDFYDTARMYQVPKNLFDS